MSTARDPIFAQLDALIAEGPQDEWDETEQKLERYHIRNLIREAGLTIDPETVFSRIDRGYSLRDAIHRPLKSNGKLGTKRNKVKTND